MDRNQDTMSPTIMDRGTDVVTEAPNLLRVRFEKEEPDDQALPFPDKNTLGSAAPRPQRLVFG